MRTAEPLVAVAGLGKTFGRRAVVLEVSFVLAPGALLGLVGANGGGKTTTLRMLAGLLRPDAGNGTVLGREIARCDKERRQGIAYMSQRPALYPDLSVAENLRFQADVRGVALPCIDDAVARYGLAPVYRQRFGALSGGWMRRVQFAAATLANPRLLLLDEPTAGLDAGTRCDMWRWIDALAAGGAGVVVSTHDTHEAMRCSHLLVFRDGRAGPPLSPAAFVESGGAPSFAAATRAHAIAS